MDCKLCLCNRGVGNRISTSPSQPKNWRLFEETRTLTAVLSGQVAQHRRCHQRSRLHEGQVVLCPGKPSRKGFLSQWALICSHQGQWDSRRFIFTPLHLLALLHRRVEDKDLLLATPVTFILMQIASLHPRSDQVFNGFSMALVSY